MQPPIGFVVEGVCEYASIEGIIRRGISAPHGRLPIVNAWGNGAVRKHLEQKLIDLVRASHPKSILVTLDLRDAIEERAFADCASLRANLQQRASDWLAEQRARQFLTPLPDSITVVIQVTQLESWLTADPEALARAKGLPGSPLHMFLNVDEDIQNPVQWLRDNAPGGFQKSPPEVLRLLRGTHPLRMADHSKSFNKLWRLTSAAYDAWSAATGIEITRIPP